MSEEQVEVLVEEPAAPVVDVSTMTFEEFHVLKMSPDIDVNAEKRAIVDAWVKANVPA